MGYSIVVWHKDDCNGLHNRVLLNAKTRQKALRDFTRYMERPESMRSFNHLNRISIYSDKNGKHTEIS